MAVKVNGDGMSFDPEDLFHAVEACHDKDVNFRVSKENHTCRWCDRKVRKGERHVRVRKSQFGYSYSRRRYHLACWQEFRQAKVEYGV